MNTAAIDLRNQRPEIRKNSEDRKPEEGGWWMRFRGAAALLFPNLGFVSLIPLFLLAVIPLRAQLVNDGATNTLSNVTNNLPGSVIVGTNGSFTLLVLSNNTLLTNAAFSTIGHSTTARSNEVQLISPTARWRAGNQLFVGSNGPLNRLVVSNGATVSGNYGYVGVFGTNNLALVTGTNSTWSNALEFQVGNTVSGNELHVRNGGTLRNGYSYIGVNTAGASNNLALISDPGSVWTNGTEVAIGYFGANNHLIVSNGATVLAGTFAFIGRNASASGNEVLVTDVGSSLRVPNLMVGQEGSFNRLVLSNGASVTADFGTVGVSGSNNLALVTGAGSTWSNAQEIIVGQITSGNLLQVQDGGMVKSPYAYVGASTVASNNLALITGPNSIWSNSVNMAIGLFGANNQMIVSNGATVAAAQNAFIGHYPTALGNSVRITDPGSSWVAYNDIYVGTNAPLNRLVVSNGAAVFSRLGELGFNTNGNANEAIITGPGSTWNTSLSVIVGRNGAGNRFTISDGGVVRSLSGFIGLSPGGLNNQAIVTGPGSAWTNQVDCIVGQQAPGNRLFISNGGFVGASGQVVVGAESSSTQNRLVVDGGTLRVTVPAQTGALDIRRGTNVLSSGVIEADILRLTNGSAGKFDFTGGTLAIKSSRINIGNPFTVGDGTNSATLFLAGNGTNDLTGTLGLILSSNATLAGNGTVLAQVQVRAGAKLIPGASVGQIIFNPPPIFSGRIEMEISKNGAVLTNDQIQVAGTVTYGGTLAVTRLGPTPLARGDKFQLFNAASYAGAFTAVTLPSLPPGLSWVNNLSLDGTIEVFGPPPTGAGFALSFDGSNDFVVVPHDSRMNGFELTVTAWVKTTQTTGEVGIINKYLAGSLNGWHVGLLNGEVRAWYLRDGANRVGSEGGGLNGGAIANGAWRHLAFTVDDNGGRLFVDGYLRDSLNWTGTPGPCTTTQDVNFARYPGGAGQFFRGELEEVAVWRFGTKTASEIKDNLDRGLLGSESGLASYHRLNEGTGTVTENTGGGTGSFTHGFLQNGVVWVPGLTLRPGLASKVATAVTVNSARLHGIANPGLTNASAWFEWGTTTNYGNFTAVQFLGSGGSNTNISQTITGLVKNVMYYFRAAASNIAGVSLGADRSFVASGTNMLSPRANHTATLLPNGKVLVTGGQGSDSQAVSSAELYDPASGTWVLTSPMSVERYHHTATLLPNGKVLVAGGEGPFFSPSHFTAELYDPLTGTWTPTGSMRTNRFAHSALVLSDGRVLVAGGSRGFSGNDPTAELYDPTTGTWTETGPLLTQRRSHTMTLLPNGKVLVAGGSFITIFSSAELYDPISGLWTSTGAMTTNRTAHTATLLRNGKVMVVGGRSGSLLRSAELYDPATGLWTPTGAMLNTRVGHTATLLTDGRVFASGEGFGGPSIYDPVLETWTDVTGPDPNSAATATLLLNGNVLVTGGLGNFLTDFDPSAEAGLFIPTNNPNWSVTAPMAGARSAHTATLLTNGLVLVASFGNSETYNPATATWANTGALNTGRSNHTATLLPNGKVLAVGGQNGVFNQFASAELFTPSLGTWTNTAPLSTNRFSHTATLLGNGKVLVAGGAEGGLFTTPSRSAELYNPATGTWTNTGAMTTNHQEHTATLLPNGKVLVAGGGTTDAGFSPNAELYDPVTGTWTAVAPMTTSRTRHFAVLLSSGKVLVAGGLAPGFFTPAVTRAAELFDPATGTWEATGLMGSARQNARATLLPNGKVLVTGGRSGAPFSVEIYDPATGEWTSALPMSVERVLHTSTLLPNGKVLVTGGYSGSGATNRVEMYDTGLITSPGWKPQILTASLNAGGSLALTGTQFRGLSGGSGGSAGQDSPTDYPIVQLRRLENEQMGFILPAGWSANSFSSTPVLDFVPGWAMATVYANGIPSDSKLLNITAVTPTAFQLIGATVGLNGSLQFNFTNTPGAPFTVLATTNVSQPLSNWAVLNGVTEVAPGQYQFTDPQATNRAQRYYRVRWP